MRQALLALIVIGVAMSLAWAGSMAYFSDTETSTGNTLQAGTLDMKIKDYADGEDWRDGVTKTWTLSNMKPGDTVLSGVLLKNAGTIQADYLDITCDYTIIETPNVESDTNWNSHPDDFAKQMRILQMDYQNGICENLLENLADADGDGIKTLYDLKHTGINNITPPPGFDDANKKEVEMMLEFMDHPNNNEVQGDTLVLEMIFTLYQ